MSATFDGCWDIKIYVPRFATTKVLKVKGEMHIGGLLLRLSESFEKEEKEDWSDYAIWWPERNVWLLRTKSTLDQYGLRGSSQLEFTQMHKILNVMLPDLRILQMRINFSVSLFSLVVKLCKSLKIRFPEELSLSRKLDPRELKKNKGVSAVRRTKIPGLTQQQQGGRNNSLFPGGGDAKGRSGSVTPEGTIDRGLFLTVGSVGSIGSSQVGLSMCSLDMDSLPEVYDLTAQEPLSIDEAFSTRLYCPKNIAEKARINAGWLDSSRSLMEQGIRENDTVLLRFKYFTFYDLNPRYDDIRISQLYQQAKWSILSDEITCSDEEMFLFAALQLQVDLEKDKPQPNLYDNKDINGGDSLGAALDCLEMSLDDPKNRRRPSQILKIPHLQDYVFFYRPKKFGTKSYKRGFFFLQDAQLSIYKDESELDQEPSLQFNIKECEVSQNINLSRKDFVLKLLVFDPKEAPNELSIRLESIERYARWLVAFKLAAKGRTMADSSYDSEVESLQSILKLQQPQQTPKNMNGHQAIISDVKPYVAPRILKKYSKQQVIERISEVHANVKEKKLIESKLEYIRAWQFLPDYGNSYFIVKFSDRKKEELLAVSTDHLTRMDTQTEQPIKTWSYTALENWSVNWDTSHVLLSVNGQEQAFQCFTADCKVVHEFIGGYIFLSLRSGDRSQTLDEEYFQKLTGGRD